jgi:tripartite-type tricarboxylate transporter receptor subunit TctC
MFVAVSTVAKQQVAAGTVRGLAVTTAQRSVLLPQLPTLAESGFPTFVMPGWGGLMAPAGTPKPIVDKINAAINEVFKLPDIRKRLATMSMQAAGGTPADMAAFVKAETARWADVIRAANIKIE